MSEEHKRLLEQQLWNIANTLRGKMNADEFRDYILGFIFYKYLSEKMHIFAEKVLRSDDLKFEMLDEQAHSEYIAEVRNEALQELGYFLLPSELFSAVAKKGSSRENNFILEDLGRILSNIEQSTMGTDSQDDFDDLFEDLDLTSTKLGRTPEAKNELIAKVLSHLDKIDFQLNNTEIDVLGDAYEYMIGQFAAGAGKKAGEFYTPQEVSRILAKIVTTGKTQIRSVYDPTCGSGSLLLRVAKEATVAAYYGQELNRTTYNLARMNMILHGVHYSNFDIKQEDTLEHPQHEGMQFEAIVANPPFSAQWSANVLFTTDERFSRYGKLAPSGKADFAFVQHMVHHLADNGTMAVVLPHGVLFRGGAEQHIRRYLIEDRNYLDAVIGLPANIFYGTSIPTCILVLKKCREAPEDILFIDASRHFEKVKNQNQLREEDIEKLTQAYTNRTEEEKYSKRISPGEIASNDYNLNIPRYVDTFEAEDEIDIDAIAAEIKTLDKKIVATDKILAAFCKELGIATIFEQETPLKLISRKIQFKNSNGKEFPEWDSKFLNELTIKRSSNISANAIEENFGEYIIYGASGVLKKVDFFQEENDYISVVKDGAGAGRLLYCKGYSSVLGTLEIIKAVEGVNLRFLYYAIQFIDFKKYITGSTIPHIYYKDYSRELIKIPSLPEQTKIARFLSAIDEKIEQTSQQIAAMEKWKKGLLQQVFC